MNYEGNYQNPDGNLQSHVKPEHILLGLLAFVLLVWLLWPRKVVEAAPTIASGATQAMGMSIAELAEMLRG